MIRTVANLALIVIVGVAIYVMVANAYPTGTANIFILGYFLLTLRLYDLLESIEDAVFSSTSV